MYWLFSVFCSLEIAYLSCKTCNNNCFTPRKWHRTHAVAVQRGHAKLRGRVLRVIRRPGCMKLVRCQCGCYVMKQHCLCCVRACANESSRSDARSKNWPLYAHISRFIHVGLSAKLHWKSSKHCHGLGLCNSVLATPCRTSRRRFCRRQRRHWLWESFRAPVT